MLGPLDSLARAEDATMHVTLIDQNGFTHDVSNIPNPLPRGMRRVGGEDAEHRGVREYHRVADTTKYREATTHTDMTKSHCASETCKAPDDRPVLFAAKYRDGVAFVCPDCYPAMLTRVD
jgi:hypothetical protein